jgi:hypothetical protein
MERQDARDFVARVARTAFTTGLRVASLPRAERARAETMMVAVAQDMLASFVEAEVERRVAAEGAQR